MLRTLILFTAGAGAIAAPAAPPADRNAATVDRALVGLVPGQPQMCINPDRSGGGNRHGGALLIKDRSGVLYLSRFAAGCATRNDNDAMISRRPSPQICRGDLVEFRDLTNGTFGGACAYGDFTPYRRPK